MKKIVLSTLLVLLVNTVFSQVKYITFTDSLLFDINGSGYVGDVKIKSIPNSNDYIVAGRYDDLMYGMDYYVVKLNYRGDVVFDTIVGFQPISSMPYAEIRDMDVSENDYTMFSNFENSNYNNQPFIANFDIYGGYNWNKYYDIDSLSFDVTGGFKTNEGGYVSYGKANNWSTISLAYIYKTDNIGSIVWSKFYGVKDSTDTDYHGEIQGLIQTKDNGFIAAFYEPTNSFSPNEGLINLLKIDNSGNIEWRESFHFDAPFNNSEDGGTSFVSLNVLDSSNVLLSVTLSDTILLTNRFGMISVNPTDGEVNWKKSYYLDAGEGNFYVSRIIKSNEPNRLLGSFNSDNYSGTLFKMDYSGNILAMETHQEQPVGNASNSYNGITATNDYGCLAYGYRYSASGQILFKTDKELKNNCSESASFSFFNLDTLGFTKYMMIDTVFDVVANEMTTTTSTPSSSVESLNDTYCSCDLSLYGNVTYSSVSADSVQVFLYKIEGSGAYHVKDSVLTDAAGYYNFNSLPEGDYIVKAKPKLTIHSGYLPTYFAMSSGALQWDSALVYSLICGNNLIAMDIDLTPRLPQTGSWTCNGYVFEYFGYNPTNKKAPGEPISDIDITVEQSPGGAISSATTDINGYYEFTGLNNNATFIVRADIPGLPNDSIYTFTVTPGDGALDSLNFYVDSVGVYILPEDIFTSVKNDIFNNIRYDVVPNPTIGMVNLIVETNENVEVDVVITNVMGELIFNKNYKSASGISKYPIDLTSYTQGIYFIRINQANDYIIKKIIKQ
ncbi:MAG: T9SS type A sorting domain-containing protein [Flavobacteriales bacterium]|nr:T9SS type A sorting domain-containing protein [Flavobacteriales bacterium]MCB9364741.1 T9SS type A sorting domain-containing protein [Flavobacteriales bacterium]